MMRAVIPFLITAMTFLTGGRGGGSGTYSWRMDERTTTPVDAPVSSGGDLAPGYISDSAVPHKDTEPAPPASAPVSAGRTAVRRAGVERPTVAAQSVIVQDSDTGRILYLHRRDTIRPIASLTKLMTAVVAREHLTDLDAPVTIAREDVVGNGRRYVYPGDVVNVGDVFALTLVSSSNDAAMALARATGLSRGAFVSAMNARARGMRLTRTTFIDPTGLDRGNVSTAQEIVRLLHEALADPVLKELLATKEYRFSTRDGAREGVAVSTNRLLGASPFEIMGAKTGYIDESGYNVALQARLDDHSPAQEEDATIGVRLTIVVLGAPHEDARFAIARELVAWTEKAWEF